MIIKFVFPNTRVKVVYIILVLIFIGLGAYDMNKYEDSTYLAIGICMVIFNALVIPLLNLILKLLYRAKSKVMD